VEAEINRSRKEILSHQLVCEEYNDAFEDYVAEYPSYDVELKNAIFLWLGLGMLLVRTIVSKGEKVIASWC